ncbi:hypothetical protein F5878DRAFT_513075, partial [Lentinula raphanica]
NAGITRKLTSLQRQAARLITGAMNTTATDILDIHAALLPMPLEIERHRHRAATRLTTLPASHPLAENVKKASRYSRRSRHFSPLHELMGTFGLKPARMETRKAVRYEANWDPKLNINIYDNEREAMRALRLDEAEVQVFTDGSGFQGGVGAAAVLYRDGEEQRLLRYRLGVE